MSRTEALTLIPKQTAAVTDTKVIAIKQNQVPATIMANDLAGSEEVDIFFSPDGGDSFATAFQEGSAIVLTATANILTIESPVHLGVQKDATVAAVGVFVSTGVNA